MRKTSPVIILLTLLTLVSTLSAQVFIPNDNVFQGMFVNGTCTLLDGTTYIFGVGVNPGIDFFVQDGNSLIVQPNVIVNLATAVQITVDGRMQAGTQLDPRRITITGYQNQRWNSIRLRGGPGNNYRATAVLYHTDIWHGGSDNGYGGLFTLTNVAENTTHPDLTFDNCNLGDSQTDAIYVFDSDPEVWISVNSTIHTMNSTVISGNFQANIAGHGIHYQRAVDNQTSTILRISDSAIEYIEHCGVLHDESRANGQDGLTVIIEDSKIRYNGEDGVELNSVEDGEFVEPTIVLDGSEFYDNGVVGGVLNGWGFKMWCLSDGIMLGTIDITNCEFVNNDEGGLCLYQVGVQRVNIDGCTSSYNGMDMPEDNIVHPIGLDDYQYGQGILLWMRTPGCGDQTEYAVVNSKITENALTGLHLRRWRYGGCSGQWYIQGNIIRNNGQNVAWQAEDPNDLMEGANIHAFANVDHLRITNNQLEGSLTGIYLEHVFFDDGQHDPDHMPRGLAIYNNIQVGNIASNTWSQYGLVIEGLDHDDGLHNPALADSLENDAIYNNVFWDNYLAGIKLSEAGGQAHFSNLDPDELCNNICGTYNPNLMQNLIGIWYVINGGPPYLNNGFWNNGAGHWVGCQSLFHVIDDPCFVGVPALDFHLEWNSAFINRGYDGIDGFHRSTTDPLMTVDLYGETVHRDRSRNDIGAYGGYFADGTVNGNLDTQPLPDWNDDYPRFAVEQTFGWDAYCVINSTCNEMANVNLPNNRNYLEGDLYRVFNSMYTLANFDFDIGNPAGGDETLPYFEFSDQFELCDYCILGQVRVHGELLQNNPATPHWVTFAGLNNDYWSRIKITENTSAGTTFKVARVCGAEYGFFISDMRVNNNPLSFANCYINHCRKMGMFIWDAWVSIMGSENPADANNVPTYQVNSIQEILDPTNNFDERGIYAGQCPALNQIYIENTMIYHCATAEVDNLNKAGIQLSSTNAHLTNVTFLKNGTVGLSLISSQPDLIGFYVGQGSPLNVANDFMYNGDQFVNQDQIDGAEITLLAGSYPIIRFNDFIENLLGADDPLGHLIWKDPNTNAGFLTADNCYWSGDVTAIPDNQANFFYWTDQGDPCSIGWNPDHGQAIDAFDELALGRQMLHNGQTLEAIGIFENIVDHYPTSESAGNAVQLLFSACCTVDAEFSGLGDYMNEVYHNQPLSPAGQNAALLRSACALRMGNEDLAREQYSEIAAWNEMDYHTLLAEIALREMDLHNSDGKLSREEFNEGRREIDRLLRKLHQASVAAELSTPERFGLLQAYPNPFNSTTRIRFNLTGEQNAKFSILDISGRQISVIKPENISANSVIWNAENITAGTYFVRLQAGSKSEVVRVILMK